jgi:hypothetical protein
MNLAKNVDGPWDQAKDKVRKDLDTIQRNVNQILAQINAPGSPIAAGAATFTSANTVTPVPQKVPTFTSSNIVTIPNNFLTFVAVNKGLTGTGTTQTPLSVNVDGSTVTINGSNQLVASGSPQLLLSASIPFSQAQINSLHSAPVKVISGVATKIVFPIALLWNAVNSAAFNFARSAFLVYNVAGTTAISASFTTSLNSPGAFTSNAGIASSSALSGGDAAIGSDVYLLGNVDNTGGTIADTATCTIFYTVV